MEKKKKYGLVLSGGGRNGAFAAGVVYALHHEYEINFSVISGTSSGAIQAPMIACGDIDLMSDLYRVIKNEDIFEKRGYIEAWWKGALNGSGPLKRLINKYIDMEKLNKVYPDKIVLVTAVNLRTGRLVYSSNDPKESKDKDFKKFCLASGSIPFVMDPVKIGNEYYVDGGLIDITPVSIITNSAFPNITDIIVISNEPKYPEILDKAPTGIFDIARRTADIVTSEIIRNDIAGLLYGHAKPNVMLIRPDKHFGDALDFDPNDMDEIWQAGYDKALRFFDKIDI